MSIPENFGDLLSWEKKSFAHLALVLRNGTPQCTPLWFDYDGTHIIINSALGRVKDKAMRQTPHVALAIYVDGVGVVATSEAALRAALVRVRQGLLRYHLDPGEPEGDEEQIFIALSFGRKIAESPSVSSGYGD